MQSSEILQEVAGQVAGCQKCGLHFSRKNAVPGEGPPNAEILLIGEGPGFYENEQGRPFVGQAGKFLDELLGKMGVQRAEVFITNVVKCRPPQNRDPLPEELLACAGYLDRQIEAINPRLVVTLGRYSMAKFMPNAKISAVHGQAVWVRGRLVAPMYHPAAALHQPSLKPQIEKDFLRLPEYIAQARAAADRGEPQAAPGPAVQTPVLPDVQQISLLDALLAPEPPTQPPVEEKPAEKNDNQATQLSLF
jgi:uracil-DNA glycosylase family 4